MIYELLIICFIFLLIILFTNGTRNNRYKKSKQYIDELIDNNMDNDNINPYLNKAQYHKDYWDVISAFNDMSIQKQEFNVANRAVNMSSPRMDELNNVIDYFMKLLNHTINKLVPPYHKVNTGWDELAPDRRVESGWVRNQKAIGIPEIYEDGVMKSGVKLINISNAEKFETADEVRYMCNLVLQKDNIKDQMLLQVKLTYEKQKTDENKYAVTIEEIFVIGFLTFLSTGYNSNDVRDINLTEVNGITDDRVIVNQINNKFKERATMINRFNNLLDAEDREFNESMPKERSL